MGYCYDAVSGTHEMIVYKANAKNIKSKYILRKIFDNLSKKKLLEIIHYNRNIQNKLNISMKDFKESSEIYSSIEIEVIPAKDSYGKFINIPNEQEESYFKIYFNKNKNEIKRSYLKQGETVEKIKIIINHQIKSFSRLFQDCKSIESMSFPKFYRKNIIDMSWMFNGCSSLKEINISNVITDNVANMKSMFDSCSSLKNINLSNFNTKNVTDMSAMFFRCSSLKNINISNFNTNNVIDMSWMFFECTELSELNVNHFSIEKVKNISCMFAKCELIEELDLSNFNTINVTNYGGIFSGCSSLKDLNIGNFVFNENYSGGHEFDGCRLLKNINIKKENEDFLREMLPYELRFLHRINIKNQ